MTNPLAQDLGGVVLLPCPFCGTQPELHLFTDEDGDPCAAVECGQCYGSGPKHVAIMDDARPAAIAAWNRRTHSAEIAGALRDAERWQPIESAPNGAWFLAHSERGWIGLARRADPDYAPGEGWFEDEHTEYLNPAWLTHWRPLPAPPTQDSAMQQGGGGE